MEQKALITQQELDELIEKRELANKNHGVSTEDKKLRKEEYKKVLKLYKQKFSEKLIKKLLKNNKSHKHL